MKTLRFFGMALFAVLMCVNFAACGDDELPIRTEENSKVGKLIFALEGMPASSGDTIHIIDRLEECSLSWKREDGTIHKGPFVALYTDKNVGSSRLEVLSFGCENHTYESNAYWRKNIDCDLYYGKMTVSYIIGEPSYYFFIFKYGDKIHEIRRYTDGRGYLWDGEWNQ